ncbi:hypothetical protein [Spongiactinospora rosea]|nr:hypothetical protein [Spongiactinospora rosea]
MPETNHGLLVLRIGDADPDRSGVVLTTPESWRTFVTQAYAGAFDRFLRM